MKGLAADALFGVLARGVEPLLALLLAVAVAPDGGDDDESETDEHRDLEADVGTEGPGVHLDAHDDGRGQGDDHHPQAQRVKQARLGPAHHPTDVGEVGGNRPRDEQRDENDKRGDVHCNSIHDHVRESLIDSATL